MKQAASLAYSSTLKMEAICCFEMSVGFSETTRRYFPDDSTFVDTSLRNSNATTLE
jgi:hypothetical protein